MIEIETVRADWVWRLRVAVVIVVSDLLQGSNVFRVEAVQAAAAEVDFTPIIQDVWWKAEGRQLSLKVY